MSELGADDLRHVALPQSPLGHRGYDEAQVDAFLDRVRGMLDGTGPEVTALDVRFVQFGKPRIGRRGYDEDSVDAFLDRIEAALAGASPGPGSEGAGGDRAAPASAGPAPDRVVATWVAGQGRAVLPVSLTGTSRPRPMRVYGPHRSRTAWIGWSLTVVLLAGTIIGIVGLVVWPHSNSGFEPLAFFCGIFLFLPPLITFGMTRPVIVASERGLTLGADESRQIIPWDQVDSMTLVQNGNHRIVVSSYAGSVTLSDAISGRSPQATFADLTRRIGQYQPAPRSAAWGMALRGPARRTPRGGGGEPVAGGSDAARAWKSEARAMRAIASQLRGGTGAQLDGAGGAAASWAPDPTGRHELRLIRTGQWTPIVVDRGMPRSDNSLSGPAAFDWDAARVTPTATRAHREWFTRGSYVFRSRWEKGFRRARLVFGRVGTRPPSLPRRGRRVRVHRGRHRDDVHVAAAPHCRHRASHPGR
jgi:DivIVA domain-containing protein